MLLRQAYAQALYISDIQSHSGQFSNYQLYIVFIDLIKLLLLLLLLLLLFHRAHF